MELIDLDLRAKRLSEITFKTNLLQDSELAKSAAISSMDKFHIKESLNHLLWVTLNAHYKNTNFELDSDMLAKYTHEIVGLPNITPNGLILPKHENQLAYNLFHQSICRAFSKLNIDSQIGRIQYPINIRLQSGKSNQAIDTRARASVKPHSDIWAGDPPGGILVFLALLGDIKNSTIKFMKPRAFPRQFVRPLEDYNEGVNIVNESDPLPFEFDESGWFLVDPYLIHKTTRDHDGYRLSIDFRFIPKEKIDSDFDEADVRKSYFISLDEWYELGDAKLFVTDELLASFKSSNDKYTRDYPVNLKIIDII